MPENKICPKCQGEMFYDVLRGYYICYSCGYTETERWNRKKDL